MTHENKIQLATSMRTHKELKEGIAIFSSAAWMKRKEARLIVTNLPVKSLPKEILIKNEDIEIWYLRLWNWVKGLFK